MASSSPLPGSAERVLVNTGTPKTIGVLNIVFGSLLILCSLGVMASMASQAAVAPMMSGVQEQQREAMRQVQQKHLDELDAQIAAADTDEAKAELQAQRDALASQDPAKMMPDVGELYAIYADPLVVGYSVADGVSGLVLNGMLIVSGIGLINLRSWSRGLAVWTCWLKIARLLLVYGFCSVVVAPFMAEAQSKAVEQMIANTPGARTGPPPGEVLKVVYGVTYTGFGVAMIVFGVIYPAIALWLLTRPAVRAACSGNIEAWQSSPPPLETGAKS